MCASDLPTSSFSERFNLPSRPRPGRFPLSRLRLDAGSTTKGTTGAQVHSTASASAADLFLKSFTSNQRYELPEINRCSVRLIASTAEAREALNGALQTNIVTYFSRRLQ
jgi:hypothetical protein